MITRKYSFFHLGVVICLIGTLLVPAEAAKKKAPSSSRGRAPVQTNSRDPYLGAIVVDVATGKILFEDNADTAGYPASMVKLMDLLILIEKIEKGSLKLDDKITANAEVSKVGGSQVYLKEHEIFSVDDLLYGMIVQSGNDAATALAIHVAGSKEGFVQLMNARATELGMKSTKFSSVHGLPPAQGQQPDVTTARDMALLCRELIKHPDIFRYTSARERIFRQDPLFVMRTHNHLLETLPGCDGLKTGYYTVAGFSISVTAIRNDRRVIAVVLGSNDRKVRDAKAQELITSAFMNLPPLPPPKPVVTNIVQAVTNAQVNTTSEKTGRNKKTRIAVYIGLSLVGIAVVIRLFRLAVITRH
ncbi:MAG: D-alanyl-D-alanine carboxypeptidase [Kiritimatiellae bacterium]|nr:D-alanyl-D-alanine carboxypeptidase [Kiritimatiellia bacterium]MDD5520405.1 D-alanyl-D-alanine carboxypeptidase [Kiritimatiellia bacterium]